MNVFVIGQNGTRLMPCKPQKARKLINEKKAKIVGKLPFTIQLTYKTGSTTQPVTVGIDTGSQHIGIAVVTEKAVLYHGEVELRSTMEKRTLMETRSSYRRDRRYRKTRYRKPKFRFKTKRIYSAEPVRRKSTGNMTHWVKVPNQVTSNRPEGWLPPSVQSKVEHHIRWIRRFLNVLPEETNLRLETARFDMARMQNPEIHGELYQRGPQYDAENIKAYVFDRDRYTCAICKRKLGSKQKDGTTLKGKVHHILYRSKGATDNPKYLITICMYCHTPEAHRKGGTLYQMMQDAKPVTRGLRDATMMNVVRKRLIQAFPEAEITYGNITKADREAILLPKSHANDAIAVATKGNPVILTDPAVQIRQVRKKKRSLHEATPRKGRKEPNRLAVRNQKNTKNVGKYHLYDTVQYRTQTGYITGFTGKAAYVQTFEGVYIKPEGKIYKQISLSELKLLRHNNNWIQRVGA